MKRTNLASAAMLFSLGVIAPVSAFAEATDPSDATTSIEQECQELSAGLEKFTKNLPVQIDDVTNMVALSAEMVDDNCHVSNVYELKEDALVAQIETMSEGNMNRDQSFAFLSSDAGRTAISNAMRSQAQQIYRSLGLTREGMTVRMTYSFDQGSVTPIVINF